MMTEAEVAPSAMVINESLATKSLSDSACLLAGKPTASKVLKSK